ncbi:EAL domain-containing protein [Tsuneonella sp. YG55]|uniref:EAL domain-containing protein n=1 Tax=Tsuneonella litorea TaxID=2976475 RepID=A0A9X3A798_9SPHN|nr:EAL domain-containing protein [Tsuneonella litorea]MCT2558151.1 EAL domain-containing protein [Tsuneonella litorea]
MAETVNPAQGSHIPRYWGRVSIFIVAAMTFSAVAGSSIPPIASVAAALGAVAILSYASDLSRLAESLPRRSLRQLGVVFCATVLPILLTALALSYWMVDGALDYHWGVASLISLTAVSTALLGNRIGLIFAGHSACWLGYALFDRSAHAIGATCAAALVLVLIARYQTRISQHERERQQLLVRRQQRAENILREYEDTGQGWFWETDRRGQLTYVSPSVARALGRERGELDGRPFVDLFDLDNDNRDGERTLLFHLSARSAFTDLAVRANAEEERWWSIAGRPIFDDFHNFCGFRGSGTDLTEKRKSAEHASRLAHFDSLTGLANRFQMSQSLERILAAPLEMHRDCAVFLLDLDRFKHVNDTLGHPAGDALLKQVAQRLERAVGKIGRVGRLGGDEFEVIVPGRVDRRQIGALAQEIISSLSQPYSVEGHRVMIGASIGIAVSPDDGTTSEALIRNADLALYAAKDGGRGRLHFYAPDLHSRAEERSRLEQDLRDAIAGNALELYYQPVVSTATEKIAGFEALLRWNHPVTGWMSPAKFIPIAEESGLIGLIGEWAIRTACADLARWPTDVRCAVNVSPLQFANPELPTIVSKALESAGVDPARLELEITESVFLNSDEDTDAMFAALKNVGVRLALDDFGTGYSSLGYLQKAPFDKIKIDQSFVRGATEEGSRNGAIIAAITSLAQALGMDTTAEGVETLDELDMVRMFGCSHIQGYIYERPLDAATATDRLRTGLTAVAQGPRSARAARHSVLRKVVLEHQGQYYNGTIRNLSQTGALIEGLWNVPVGTIFRVALSDSASVTATARWSTEDRIGVEFATRLERNASGMFVALASESPSAHRPQMRRTA